MDTNIESALITALIGGLLSGIIVAVVSHVLSRRKTEAEIEEMEANTEKTRLEIAQLRTDMDDVQKKVRIIDRLRLGDNSSVVLKEEQQVLGVRREKY